MDKIIGTTVSGGIALMKLTAGLNPTLESYGSTLSVKNGEIQSSIISSTITLASGDGFVIYSFNKTNTDALRHLDGAITIRRT